MRLSENVKLQFIQKDIFIENQLYVGLFKNLLKTVDLYHIHNIAWHVFIENQLKMQIVWDARRNILAKWNKGPYYNKKHKKWL